MAVVAAGKQRVEKLKQKKAPTEQKAPKQKILIRKLGEEKGWIRRWGERRFWSMATVVKVTQPVSIIKYVRSKVE